MSRSNHNPPQNQIADLFAFDQHAIRRCRQRSRGIAVKARRDHHAASVAMARRTRVAVPSQFDELSEEGTSCGEDIVHLLRGVPLRARLA